MTAKSEKTTEQLNATDLLNRATLRLTFNTLRKNSPSSALLIQNLLMQNSNTTTTRTDADVFAVNLSDEQIEHVIQALLALCLLTSQEQYPSFNMNTLRGLLNQWTKVANHRKLLTEEVNE